MTTTAKILGSQPAYARPASLDNTGSSHQDGDRHVDEADGLTKREAFAMAALQGMLANNAIKADNYENAPLMARGAKAMADALLGELAKEAQ
jgi:hypothetical protein